MGRVADTRYRTYPYDTPQGTRGAYVAPFGTSEYYETHDALDTVVAAHDDLAMRAAQPPPARFGYSRTEKGIREILSVARLYPDQSRTLSGTEAGYTGSPRNALGNLYG